MKKVVRMIDELMKPNTQALTTHSCRLLLRLKRQSPVYFNCRHSTDLQRPFILLLRRSFFTLKGTALVMNSIHKL